MGSLWETATNRSNAALEHFARGVDKAPDHYRGEVLFTVNETGPYVIESTLDDGQVDTMNITVETTENKRTRDIDTMITVW